MKAIVNGNNRRIDGWYIRVKKASYGWKKMRSSGQRWVKKIDEVAPEDKVYKVFRDNTSYKDVLLGPDQHVVAETNMNVISNAGESSSNDREDVPIYTSENVNYDFDIPKSKMEWLDTSVIGRIRGCILSNEVTKDVVIDGFNVSISSMYKCYSVTDF